MPGNLLCFLLLVRPGYRFGLKIKPDVPLEDLRLQIDRDDDGTYEEIWMPEATVMGKGTDDWVPTVTNARVGKVRDQLIRSLEAKTATATRVAAYWRRQQKPAPD